MKKNEISSDWIDRFNNNELDEYEKAIFEERMNDNPLLRSEVYLDARLNRFLMDGDVIDLMTKIKSASRRNEKGGRVMNTLMIAASVWFFAMIGGLFYFLGTHTTPTGLSAISHPGEFERKKENESGRPGHTSEFQYSGDHGSILLKDESHKGLVIANFKPLAGFELLIGSAMRAGGFKLLSPGVILSIPGGTEVMFAWRCVDQHEPLSLSVLDNQGRMVSEIQFDHTGKYFLETKGFREGLYYWKILSGDDLMVMGKFTILPGIKI